MLTSLAAALCSPALTECQSVVTKKEREEFLWQYLELLSRKLPLIEFYRTVYPTDEMKLAVARIFVEITKLLDEALVYFRSGRLGMFLLSNHNVY
jgi:hypothetical protein